MNDDYFLIENTRERYYGLYYQEKNRREEAEAQNQRLKQLLMQYQNIIIDQSQLIRSLRQDVCDDHTIVTYMLQPVVIEEEV